MFFHILHGAEFKSIIFCLLPFLLFALTVFVDVRFCMSDLAFLCSLTYASLIVKDEYSIDCESINVQIS